MKPKKLSKKLVLNKKTIANMNAHMMGNVNGGLFTPLPTCEITCQPTTCVTCPETCYTICHREGRPGLGGEMIQQC